MIISHPTNDDYREGWERVFGAKTPCTACDEDVETEDQEPLCDACSEHLEAELADG